MFSAALKSGAAAAPTDPNFENVTLLLHGDGTNGGQNNTFLDSSTNNFTITRNGNTTQGSFSPYGPNWSVAAVSTSTNYLTVGSTVALGSSDYTVEFWFAGNNFELSWGTPGDYSPIVINSSGDLYFADSGNANWAVVVSGFIIQNGSWNHYAIVRQSGAGKVFRNGTQIATPTVPSSNATNGNVVIGYYDSGMGGNVSNFRAVVGTAVYTSAFTPPTASLTAITNTQLLTCQSNRFIDNSTNNFAITRFGDVSVQRFSPFAPPAAYSPATIGGSGFFDGSGDFLTASTNAAFNFGTGDFTMECWAYGISTPNDSYLMAVQASGGVEILMTVNGGNFRLLTNASGSFVYTTFSAMPLNQWVHLAIVRESGVCYGYTNGVKSGTSVSLSNNLATGFFPSINGSGAKYLGYLTDARMVKGTAVYTATFTPPTAPLTAITDTSLLLNFTNAAIFDNAMMNDLETVGNAQISTSVVKYGTGSMSFDGSGDYLISPDTFTGNFGTGDFTVEFWWYGGAQPARYPCQVGTLDAFSATGAWRVTTYDNNANNFMFIDGITNYSFSTSNFNNSAWRHVAVTRSGTTVRGFIDGVQQGSSATVSTSFSARKVVVGGQFRDNDFISGYIDDLRITKGVARYTATFTPPTAAFPNL
jgi:hypothetical protein